MHSPVTVYSAYSWIGFLLPTIVPASKSNVRLGIPNRLSIQYCNVWSDGLLLKRLAVLFLYVSKCRACFFSAPPLDDMRSI